MMAFETGETKSPANLPLYDAVYADGVLSQDVIDELHALAKKCSVIPAKIGGDANGVNDSYMRRSNITWLEPNIVPTELAKHFENVIVEINKRHFEFQLTGCEAFQYTVYEAGNAGEYKWHIDTMRLPDNCVRKISMSLLLSDPSEFEGGRLILAPSGVPLVAEERKGRAVFFPSWVPHCVTPVTKGVRRSLVIWTHGAMFK